MNKEQSIDLTNLPDDYITLRNEAIAFAEESKKSFLSMVIRLLKIKEEKLYKDGGYSNFTEFLEAEFEHVRSTAYNYINAIKYYGVQTFVQNPDIEYTKLLPSIQLLKSDLAPETREQIKEVVIEDINNGITFKDMKERVYQLELQLGLNKDNNRTVKRSERDSPVGIVDTIGTIEEEEVELETSNYVGEEASEHDAWEKQRESSERKESIEGPAVEKIKITDDFKDKVELSEGQVVYKGQVILEFNEGLDEELKDRVYKYMRNNLQKYAQEESEQAEEDDEGVKKKIRANIDRRNYDKVYCLVRKLGRLPLDKNATDEELRKKEKVFKTKEEVKKYQRSPFWDVHYDRSKRVYRVRQKPRRSELVNYEHANLIADIMASGKEAIIKVVFEKSDIATQHSEIRNIIFNKYIKKITEADKRNDLVGIVRMLYDYKFSLYIEHSKTEYEPLLSWAITNKLNVLTDTMLQLYDEGYPIDLQESSSFNDGMGASVEYTPLRTAIFSADANIVNEFLKRVNVIDESIIEIFKEERELTGSMIEKKELIIEFLERDEEDDSMEAIFEKAVKKRQKDRLLDKA